MVPMVRLGPFPLPANNGAASMQDCQSVPQIHNKVHDARFILHSGSAKLIEWTLLMMKEEDSFRRMLGISEEEAAERRRQRAARKEADSVEMARELLKANLRIADKLQKHAKRPIQVVEKAPKARPTGPKLSEVVAQYIQHNVVARRWSEQTRLENEARFRDLVEIVGDRPIREVDRPMMIRYAEILGQSRTTRRAGGLRKAPKRGY
jgi:hypothetical protein